MDQQMPNVERRYLREPAEWRASPNGPGTLYGYAAKFNTRSQDLGGFTEMIAPGAFNKTMGESRVLCRYNHSDNHLLGTTTAGTLRLSVDDVGLRYEVDMPDTTTGRDVSVLAQRGDVRFSSFAFRKMKDGWEFPADENGLAERTLYEVGLIDVAPVNSPAYLDTSVAKRSLTDHQTAPVVVDDTPPVAPVVAAIDESEEPVNHSADLVATLAALIALDEAK